MVPDSNRGVYLHPIKFGLSLTYVFKDLDIKAIWDEVTRNESRGIVVWQSTNLVDWSSSILRT